VKTLSLPPLDPSYQALLEEKRFADYAAALCRDGLSWWFDMKIPEIAAHLAPLQALPPTAPPPPRIVFLAETIKPQMSPDVFEQLHHVFEEQQDWEAASASACAGAAAVWDSGVDFERFAPWLERIGRFIDNGFDDCELTRAGLLNFRGEIELTFQGDMEKALRTYKEMMLAAEKAGSQSLRLFSASAQIYPLLWLGRVSEIEALVMSAGPLMRRPEVSLFCRVYFVASFSLWLSVKGRPDEGEALMEELASQPFFTMLAPSIQLLCLGHFLTASAFQNKIEKVKQNGVKIISASSVTGNSFHTAYAHYCLGAAWLLAGEPRPALSHAREALVRGKASGSPIPAKTNPLLEAQALIDLGQTKEAKDILNSWIEPWKTDGFNIYAASGLRELAAMAFRAGRMDEARAFYDQALAVLPKGEKPPQLHRKPGFGENLEKALYASEHAAKQGISAAAALAAAPLVSIKTFGELQIDIGPTSVYDRKWRGRSTKKLLKAVVSLGGKKISFERIAQLLWPDAEGASAAQNLRVSIHRLKKLAVPEGCEPFPWLAVKHKTVSLSSLCRVDSLEFDERLTTALRQGADIEALKEILDLYADDFLAQDHSESWIVHRRSALRVKFVSGVAKLAELAEKQSDFNAPVPYLEKAIALAPLCEELYERLMSCRLRAGRPVQALVVFKDAEAALARELGAQPGARLQELVELALSGN